MANLKKLVRKRDIMKARLTAFHNYIEGILNTLSGQQIDDIADIEIHDRIESISAIAAEFEACQSEIEQNVEEDVLEREFEYRTMFENDFHRYVAQAKALLNKLRAISNSSSNTSPESQTINHNSCDNQIKMPEWKLPQFDGSNEKWSLFYETFKESIHANANIPSIKKFQYLSGALEGAAALLIQGLPMTAANYEIAWSLIERRYENKTLRIHGHIKGIFEFPRIGKESHVSLRQLLDNFQIHYRALKALGEPVDHWDTLLIYLINDKVDFPTKREWERCAIDIESDQKYKAYIDFLESRCQLLERIEKSSPKPQSEQTRFRNQNKFGHNQKYTLSNASVNSQPQCPLCNARHDLYACKQFHSLSVEARFDEVKKLQRCVNCLRSNHKTSECKTTKRCRKCSKLHHTLLHREVSQLESEITDREMLPTIANHCINQNQICHVLPTARVQVKGRRGELIQCTVLLDSGSQSNFITSELCRKLDLPIQRVNVPVAGISDSSIKVSELAFTEIRSVKNDFKSSLSLLIVSRITAPLPSEPINISKLKLPKNITLADPQFYIPKKIDLLIGVDLFWELLCPEPQIHPYLHQTKLGYVVSGKILNQNHCSVVCGVSVTTRELSQQLKQFWEIETCNNEPSLSLDEEACEAHFVKTTERDEQGRFIVSIPFKGPLNTLGNSRKMAERRFYLLEKRLDKDNLLKERYIQFMRQYLALGHMTKVTNLNLNSPHYFLPHHGVLKESSSTTKLRVVFDASAPTSSGLSLNDLQIVGPTIQPDLFSIDIRFRQHAFVVRADIKMMYRQVFIKFAQRVLQLILWRESPTDEIEVFQLNTVTYGEASSPFLAIRCLFELAILFETMFPIVSYLIRNSMYVDDFVHSFKTRTEAITQSKNLKHVLSSGGFQLTKWVSNDSDILAGIQEAENSCTSLSLGQTEMGKTLGLCWTADNDKLYYDVNTDIISNFTTKRTVLSVIARIFDPLGLVSPCTIIAKTILQELWKSQITWDEPLPAALKTQWSKLLEDFPYLNKLQIERQVSYSDINELHVFSDASKIAYGACAYIRSVESSGQVSINLLCSKTRVAPLPSKKSKLITIPRLELCGALLAKRLTDKIRSALTISINRTVMWCDSTIVLGWLKKNPNKLSEFVAHRVSEIQELKNVEWRYVASGDNPADLLSRGVNPKLLASATLWWHGPSWLIGEEPSWPQNDYNIPTLPEVKSTAFIVRKITPPVIQFENYSDLNRLERIAAWCNRFIHNAKSPSDRKRGPLNLSEIRAASICLARLSQQESFSTELHILSGQGHLGAKTRLLKLNPFLHNDGTLRVGGRLSQANFTFNKRHPIILASNHRFTRLLFLREHKRLLHAAPQALLAATRDQYWTISGRNLARKIVHNCVRCFRTNPQNLEPMMGDLPIDRIDPAPPFNTTGVDYAGPILIKDRKGRGAKTTKAYISLFICFVTKAVHLELVSDLSTNTFILAMRRFASRRGMPSKMISDNGLNFVGAKNELRELGKFLKTNETELQERLTHRQFNWVFIPSYSPHFGGLWEAGIKSVKSHLKRVVGTTLLTFEELYTVLTQIEAILNSRPLTPLSSNAIDCLPITPAHFLTGRPLMSVPDPDVTHISESRLSRYQRIQRLQQLFWKRWSTEYISELQCRTKWRQQMSTLSEGTMVVIKDPNAPPLQWLLGIVEKIHPGKDGITRVATVKTHKGLIQRAVVKLCPLPQDST